jgi:RNA polymerase sigma-70 factor (ECF subfamily)
MMGSPADTTHRIDATTFPALVRDHAATVLRYARQRVGADLAEDIVSDTFADAWRRRERFNAHPGDNAAAWLLGIATFVVARHRRAEQRWLQMRIDTAQLEAAEFAIDESARADEQLDAVSVHARLIRALARLPRRERDPLLLHVQAGLDYDAIAEALDVPLGTIKSRISRGRTRLEHAMERDRP